MIGVITGSGTYALPGLRRASRARSRRASATVRVDASARSPAPRSSTSRATSEGHQRLSNHVRHQANVVALQRARRPTRVLGVTVCGAVDPALALGSLVVFDDLHFLANRLADGSICTLHDTPGEPGRGHWIFEGPFCAPLRPRCSTARARPGTPSATAAATATSTARGSTRGRRSARSPRPASPRCRRPPGRRRCCAARRSCRTRCSATRPTTPTACRTSRRRSRSSCGSSARRPTTFATTLAARGAAARATAELAPVGTHFRFD